MTPKKYNGKEEEWNKWSLWWFYWVTDWSKLTRAFLSSELPVMGGDILSLFFKPIWTGGLLFEAERILTPNPANIKATFFDRKTFIFKNFVELLIYSLCSDHENRFKKNEFNICADMNKHIPCIQVSPKITFE
jgi:hypothetical protein